MGIKGSNIGYSTSHKNVAHFIGNVIRKPTYFFFFWDS